MERCILQTQPQIEQTGDGTGAARCPQQIQTVQTSCLPMFMFPMEGVGGPR